MLRSVSRVALSAAAPRFAVASASAARSLSILSVPTGGRGQVPRRSSSMSGLAVVGLGVAASAFAFERSFASSSPTDGKKHPTPAATPVAAPAAPAASVSGGGSVNYVEVRKAIAAILDAGDYDDGSYGPLFVRLAWHASGTYDKNTKTGGSNGATMRFPPESTDGANNGLDLARKLLEPIKAQFPGISYGDLWTLAGVVAIEEMGGPVVPWRPGRADTSDPSKVPPNGRLPDALKVEDHVRAVFSRMGFNDQETVALIGAHCLGRCHTDRSGFLGPWTNAPTTFSNLYFVELLNQKWTQKQWNGPTQYEDSSKALMMLPADLALINDPQYRKHVEAYAKDSDKFFADFAKAFSKLLELGVPFPDKA